MNLYEFINFSDVKRKNDESLVDKVNADPTYEHRKALIAIKYDKLLSNVEQDSPEMIRLIAEHNREQNELRKKFEAKYKKK